MVTEVVVCPVCYAIFQITLLFSSVLNCRVVVVEFNGVGVGVGMVDEHPEMRTMHKALLQMFSHPSLKWNEKRYFMVKKSERNIKNK